AAGAPARALPWCGKAVPCNPAASFLSPLQSLALRSTHRWHRREYSQPDSAYAPRHSHALPSRAQYLLLGFALAQQLDFPGAHAGIARHYFWNFFCRDRGDGAVNFNRLTHWLRETLIGCFESCGEPVRGFFGAVFYEG